MYFLRFLIMSLSTPTSQPKYFPEDTDEAQDSSSSSDIEIITEDCHTDFNSINFDTGPNQNDTPFIANVPHEASQHHPHNIRPSKKNKPLSPYDQARKDRAIIRSVIAVHVVSSVAKPV